MLTSLSCEHLSYSVLTLPALQVAKGFKQVLQYIYRIRVLVYWDSQDQLVSQERLS